MFEGWPGVSTSLDEMVAVKDFVSDVLTWLAMAILHDQAGSPWRSPL